MWPIVAYGTADGLGSALTSWALLTWGWGCGGASKERAKQGTLCLWLW